MKTAAFCIMCLVSAGCLGADNVLPGNEVNDIQVAYAQWTNGPSSDPGYFPIGVWVQNPRDASRYRKLGINLYLGLSGGPTESQLAELKKAGMKTICSQNAVGLKHIDDPTIIGWMHGDEPDNFKKNADGKWVPKRKSDSIIADYRRLIQNDPSRPVLLNLGQGVSNDQWKGGWATAEDYRQFVRGCDIVSYDIYPASSTRAEVAGRLELCAKGVSRLRQWSDAQKFVWFITEAAHIHNAKRMATPAEIRFEVWSSIIHGAQGIIYFCHQWEPTKDFASPLHNPVTRDSLMKVNAQITSLAPVLNSPSVVGEAEQVKVSDGEVPIAVMQKHYDGAVFVFAAAMGKGKTSAAFHLGQLPHDARVKVLGENRSISNTNGMFTDDFSDHEVHIYRIE